MHIAETKEKAMADVRFGLEKWIYYFREIANLPIVPEGDDPVKAMVDTGLAVIGTPDDAIARIRQLVDESGGGFGAFLLMAHNWADWGATKHSYELMARYVFPHFQNLNDNRTASMAWVKENKAAFTAEVRGAVGARIVQHMMEKGAENISPQIVELITSAAAAPKTE
jgi:limonene 1,2-monooxygenase